MGSSPYDIEDKIIAKSISLGFNEIVEQLNFLASAGATGGEIISTVGGYLCRLKSSNPNAYEHLKNDIKDFVDACKPYGIYIYE